MKKFTQTCTIASCICNYKQFMVRSYRRFARKALNLRINDVIDQLCLLFLALIKKMQASNRCTATVWLLFYSISNQLLPIDRQLEPQSQPLSGPPTKKHSLHENFKEVHNGAELRIHSQL